MGLLMDYPRLLKRKNYESADLRRYNKTLKSYKIVEVFVTSVMY